MVSSVRTLFIFNQKQTVQRIRSIEYRLKKIKPISRSNRRKINNLHCELKSKKMHLASMKPTMPEHSGKSMSVSCTIAELRVPQTAGEFDSWLHLFCIGRKTVLDLPIKFHQHYNNLVSRGKRLNSYIITESDVQFTFEIETGSKKQVKSLVGVDTGINALASLSTGEQLGKDVKLCIERSKRCQHGSKGHKRASRALRQRMDEVAKQVTSKTDLVVVEDLKGISTSTKLKGRLSQNMRSSIGRWNQSYWLRRLEQKCEDNRVAFRTVSPQYTSVACPICGNVDRTNRFGEMFKCSVCCHTDNADVNAARNILNRFVTGPYGACYKVLV